MSKQAMKLAEIDELREKLADHKAARIAYASEFPKDAEGEPDVGNIHANIRALKTKLAALEVMYLNSLADATQWQLYKSRKDAVIAAGMGKKAMRDSSTADAPICTSDEWLVNCPQSVRDLADKIKAGAAPNKQVIEELEQLKAKLADQTKAADHWMGEACKNHNDLVRANEKLEEFMAQKPVAWLYEVNGRIKLETKRLDNYYWMGEGDSWVKGKPLILAAGAAPVPRMTGAALASQEPVAEVLLVDGEKVIDASMAFFDSVELGTKLYLAAGAEPVQRDVTKTKDGILRRAALRSGKVISAGAAPVQQEPEPIQVCRLMKKEEGIWVAASEFYAGHPDQKWVKLVSTNPGSWSIQRRVTGKQIADGLAKALAGTPPALEVTECQWSFEDDDSGTWRSSCGELWSFIDGGPNENRVTYCHHCGGKVSNAAAAARVRCFNCGNDQTVEFSYAKSAPAKEQA